MTLFQHHYLTQAILLLLLLSPLNIIRHIFHRHARPAPPAHVTGTLKPAGPIFVPLDPTVQACNSTFWLKNWACAPYGEI